VILDYNKTCDEFVKGKNVKIGTDVEITGGKIFIDDNTVIEEKVKIYVTESLKIGKDSLIRENSIIKGRDIKLGREFYTNHHTEIGGGSSLEKTSKLTIGYWFHFGSYSMINTAMEVKIGNEVGMGRFSNIYTHGVYQSILQGYPVTFGPVTIGNNVWMPCATINPNIKIGDNVVIGVGSIVIKDIPSNSFAVGVPCEIKKLNIYPKELDVSEQQKIVIKILNDFGVKVNISDFEGLNLKIDKAVFKFDKQIIEGEATKNSERARILLRRHGVRFKVDIVDDFYHEW
jgi:acetyltransferase-like isoleucine patch superfamily enzyme